MGLQLQPHNAQQKGPFSLVHVNLPLICPAAKWGGRWVLWLGLVMRPGWGQAVPSIGPGMCQETHKFIAVFLHNKGPLWVCIHRKDDLEEDVLAFLRPFREFLV